MKCVGIHGVRARDGTTKKYKIHENLGHHKKPGQIYLQSNISFYVSFTKALSFIKTDDKEMKPVLFVFGV